MRFYRFLRQIKNISSISVLLFGIILISYQTLMADDWTQWRGANRDGISKETGWSTGEPKQLWKVSVGMGYSSMAVVKDRVYTLGNIDKEDTIYCLNANDGSVIWKYTYPCIAEGAGYPGPASTPAVDGDYVYTLSREGHLFCLGANDGKVMWSKHVEADFGVKAPDWQFSSSPLIMDDKLVLAVGKTIAFDKKSGNPIWETKDYHGGYSSAIAFKHGNKNLLAIFNTLGLVINDAKTGQELANAEWKTDYSVNAVTPIVYGDNIFISSGYNTGGALYQFDGKKLTQVWKNKNMRNHFNSSVLWNGYLYGIDENQLRCLDFNTGAVKWTERWTGKGSLMLADGKLIVLGEKGDLAIAEAIPDRYKEIVKAKVLDGLCWTVPVLSNGKIFCRSHEGDLVCLDVKAK